MSVRKGAAIVAVVTFALLMFALGISDALGPERTGDGGYAIIGLLTIVGGAAVVIVILATLLGRKGA